MDNFVWDGVSSDEDFFASVEKEDKEKDDKTSAENVVKEINKDNDEEQDIISKTNDGKSEEEEVNDFFAETDNTSTEGYAGEEEPGNPEGGSEEGKSKKEKVEKLNNVSTLNFLKDKGLASFELEEGEELTEEMAEDLLEDSYENTIEERIAAKLQSLPNDAKNMITFVLKGGTMNQYLEQVTDNTIDIDEDIDLTSEKNQEKVMRAVLELEGEDEEDIEERIEYFKDKGTLASNAERKLKKYLEDKASAEQASIQQQNRARENAKKQERENKRAFASYLSEQKEIQGLPVPRKAKNELPSYLYDKTVELENGGKITPMQKALFYDLPKNQAAYAQLAILLQNLNSDGTFNFDSITKKAETTVVREVKEKMRRTDTSKGTSSANRTVRQDKALSSYFD